MLKRLLEALQGSPLRKEKEKETRQAPPAPRPEMPFIRVPGGSGNAGISVRISTLSREEEGHHHSSRAFDLVDFALAAVIIAVASIAANLTHFQFKSLPVEVHKVTESPPSESRQQSASSGSRLSRPRTRAKTPGAEASQSGEAQAPVAGAAEEAMGMAATDGPPEPIRILPGLYTQQARDSGFHGKVFATVSVTAQGSAEDIQFAGPVPFDLRGPARDAIRQWRFRPAIRNGAPAAGKCFVEIPFR